MATAESSAPPSIDELEKKLRDAERELATKSSQRDLLKENIAAVKKIQMELTQSSDTYSKAREGLKAGKKELDEYYESKWRMLQGAIEKHQEDIKNVIKAQEKKIDDQRKKVGDLKALEEKASRAFDTATSTLLEKKIQFEGYKDYKAQTDKKMKEAQGFKTRAEKEDDTNHPAGMYVLLLEMEKSLNQVRVISTDELNRTVRERWSEFYEANNDARAKKITLDEAKQTLKTEELVLQDLEQKRVDDILSSVSKYDKAEATSPPSSTGNKRSSSALQQH